MVLYKSVSEAKAGRYLPCELYMAKAIRERDSKAILYNYLNQLLAQETRKGFQLPSLKSVTVSANTDLEELTLKQPWLEKQVQIIV